MTSKTISATFPTLEQLYRAGAHFGHIKQRSHPKAYPYSYTIRNKVMVIDLDKLLVSLQRTLDWLKEEVKLGKTILFVGTKRQAAPLISQLGQKTGAKYVVNKWLGGTLTNFATIKRNLKTFTELQERFDKEEMSKKARSRLTRQLNRMHKLYDGLIGLEKLPDAVFVVDGNQEKIALSEARQVGIKTAGIIDTDTNPNQLDYPIVSNDDSSPTLALIFNLIEAVFGGQEIAPAGKSQSKTDKSEKKANKKVITKKVTKKPVKKSTK